VLVLAREERRQELDAREVRAQAAEGAHVRHLHGVLALRLTRRDDAHTHSPQPTAHSPQPTAQAVAVAVAVAALGAVASSLTVRSDGLTPRIAPNLKAIGRLSSSAMGISTLVMRSSPSGGAGFPPGGGGGGGGGLGLPPPGCFGPRILRSTIASGWLSVMNGDAQHASQPVCVLAKSS
jgi:hypothetical protein